MPATRTCPQCGAELAGQPHCWLCQSKIAAPAPDRSTAAPPHYVPPWQFGIDSMLLVTTFAAVLIGALVAHPGVGIALAVVTTPALLRTVIIARRDRVAGEPLSAAQKLWMFLATGLFVVVLAIASGVAFYATCWAGFVGGTAVFSASGSPGYGPLIGGLWFGVGLGVVCAIAFAAWIIRRAWRRDFRRPDWFAWLALACGVYTMGGWLIFYSSDPQAFAQIALPTVAAIALGISLVSLFVAKRYITPIAIGLSAGPLLATLMILPFTQFGPVFEPWTALEVVPRAGALLLAIGIAWGLDFWLYGRYLPR